MEKLTRIICPEIRVVDAVNRIVSYIASDETLDSYNEVIRVKGWRFNLFRKNPVFVDSHDYSSISKVLGRVIDFRIENGKLVETVQWANAPDNTLADLGWKLTEAGILKAVSVGFFPVKSVGPSDPGFQQQLKELNLDPSKPPRRIFTEQEQIELSAVVIGANPNALAKAYRAGAISGADYEHYNRLRSGNTESPSTRVETPIHTSGPSTHNTGKTMSQREELLAAFDQLTPTTKSAFERLTLLKNRANGTDSELYRALRDVLLQLRREELLAYGDPVQKICSDPTQRTLINAIVRRVCDAPLSDEQAAMLRAIGEDASPGGDYIIEKLDHEIYDLLHRYGKWSTLGVRLLRSKSTKYPIRTARPVASWILQEAQEIDDDTNMAGSTVLGDVLPIGVLLNVSDAWVKDTQIDLSYSILDDFEHAINLRLDHTAFAGDGDADAVDGGQTGLFVNGTASAAAAGNTTVEKLDFDDVLRAVETVDSAALDRDPRWWMHPAIMVKLLRVKDGSGRPLFATPMETPSRGIASILGWPVTLAAACPSDNSAGKRVIAFGDPRSQVVGIRLGFQFESSGHFRWNKLQRTYRGIVRAHTKTRNNSGLAIITTAAE